MTVEEADGHSRGIWALMDNGVQCSITYEDFMPQCISLCIVIGNNTWFGLAIYASPNFPLRKTLWSYLKGIRGRLRLPWMLVEDFNDILCSAGQKGQSIAGVYVCRWANYL